MGGSAPPMPRRRDESLFFLLGRRDESLFFLLGGSEGGLLIAAPFRAHARSGAEREAGEIEGQSPSNKTNKPRDAIRSLAHCGIPKESGCCIGIMNFVMYVASRPAGTCLRTSVIFTSIGRRFAWPVAPCDVSQLSTHWLVCGSK